MTDDLRARLKKDQRIIDAATDGPWCAEYSGEQGNCVIPHDAKSTREAVAITRLYYQQADAEFIAASRTRWEQANRALLAVLEMEDEPISGGTMMGYEIHEAEGANRMLREVRRVIQEAME